MTQPTDIAIADAGYMLVPGTYRRSQDGIAEGRTGRIAMSDFFGGLRRPLQLERDRAFAGKAVGPALGGQGVQPWAHRYNPVSPITMEVAPSADVRVPWAIVDDRLYFATGKQIFKCAKTPFSWTIPNDYIDTVEPIEDMCLYSSNGFLVTFGAAKDVTWYRASDKSSTVLLAGEQGHAIAGYGGYAIWNDARTAGRPTYLRQVTGTQIDLRILDYDVKRLVSADARIYAVTSSAIYSYSGRVSEQTAPNPAYSGPGDEDPPTMKVLEWSGNWTPFFQHGVAAEMDDYKLFEGYGGRIYSWVAGEVMEFNPNGDRAGWKATGLQGIACLGGCVAGGYLVVSIISHENMNQLWAWDGSGWWMIDEKVAATTGNWCWPLNVHGGGNYDLLVFHDGLKSYTTFRLQYRSDSLHNFPTYAEFTTPMIDGSERDKKKAWRKIGAVFASPERNGNTASTDIVNVSMYYSIDGGDTWEAGGITTRTGNTLANMNFELDKAISVAAESRFIMVRIEWQSVSDWSPILVGLWAEFEVMDSPARRRTWTMDIIAADQVIDRDGVPLARTGRELIAELWNAWDYGSTLTFRDIDYDAAPTVRGVRIIGIEERAPKPSDHGRWGDSVVSLKLVEV